MNLIRCQIVSDFYIYGFPFYIMAMLKLLFDLKKHIKTFNKDIDLFFDQSSVSEVRNNEAN